MGPPISGVMTTLAVPVGAPPWQFNTVPFLRFILEVLNSMPAPLGVVEVKRRLEANEWLQRTFHFL